MRSLVPAILFLALPPAADAAEFEAGLDKTIEGRCHMDYCSFSTIEASVPVAVLRDGTLFAISGQAWGAQYTPTDRGDDYTRPPKSIEPKKPYIEMIFCSKVQPYIFDYGGGHWQAGALKPGDDEAVFGYNESAYQQYWAACHHFFPKSPYDTLVHKVAPKLGYHFSGGLPKKDPITQPSDLMKSAR